jgi:hypothetical protein
MHKTVDMFWLKTFATQGIWETKPGLVQELPNAVFQQASASAECA